MDLRNGRITVGGLMAHPTACALLEREFPMLCAPRVRRQVWDMPLGRVLQLAPRFLPQSKINGLLRQLREIE